MLLCQAKSSVTVLNLFCLELVGGLALGLVDVIRYVVLPSSIAFRVPMDTEPICWICTVKPQLLVLKQLKHPLLLEKLVVGSNPQPANLKPHA